MTREVELEYLERISEIRHFRHNTNRLGKIFADMALMFIADMTLVDVLAGDLTLTEASKIHSVITVQLKS